MRFIGGFAVPDRQNTPDQHGIKHFDSHLSLNSDLLLGGKQASRLRKKKSEKRLQNDNNNTERSAREHEFWANGDRSDFKGYKSLEAKLKAQELLLGARGRTDTDLVDMARDRDGPPRLMLWPELERQSRAAHDAQPLGNLDARTTASGPAASQGGIATHAAMPSSSIHEYYDPAKEPLSVSQQTSASAVRDMGLRKSLSTWKLHNTNTSDPTLASSPTSSKRPLKSAMKKSHAPPSRDGSQYDDVSSLTKVKTSGSERKPRRLDLAQFFPQQRNNSGKNLLSADRRARSPSAVTDASQSIYQLPQYHRKPIVDTVVVDNRRKVAPVIDSVISSRTKAFEDDVLDSAKTNVRRPPKGIQNWFDGFDISSDEEEHELAKHNESQPAPQELPAEEKAVYGGGEKQTHGGQPLPSTFSPWKLKPATYQPTVSVATKPHRRNRSMSANDAKAKLEESIRLASSRKGSVDSAHVSNLAVPGEHIAGNKPPSRLALSRLASQSVLSLSDSDGDSDFESARPTIRDSVDDASVILESASQVDVLRLPVSPPRQLHSYLRTPSHALARTHSASTVQTSGSIPIRLTGPAASSLPQHSSPLVSPPMTNSRQGTHNDKALRKLEGRRDSASQASLSVCSRTTSKTPTDFETAYTRRTTKLSNADVETLHSDRTGASSAVTEGAHMMQVTEDEMQLLEMIRQRRAMKAKDSFAEGYQLALKKEHEALVRRRQSAQQTAFHLLSLKEEKQRIRDARSGRRASKTTDTSEIFSEHLRTKYNALREEEVDQQLKLERFLAASGQGTPMTSKFPETPLADKFPDPPTRQASYDTLRSSHRRADRGSMSSRSVRWPSQPQQLELLLPDTYSPVSERAAPAAVQFHGRRNRRSASMPPATLVNVERRTHSPVPVDEEVEDHGNSLEQSSASSQQVSDEGSETSQRSLGELQAMPLDTEAPDVKQEAKHSRQSSGLGKIIASLKVEPGSETSSDQLPDEMDMEDGDKGVALAPDSPPPRNPRRKYSPTPLPGDEANDRTEKILRSRFRVDTALANNDRSALPSPLRPSLKAEPRDSVSISSPMSSPHARRALTASPPLSPAGRRNSSIYSTATPVVDIKAPTEGGASDSSTTSYSQLTTSHSSASSPPSVFAKREYRVPKKVAQPPRLDTISQPPKLDTVLGLQRSFSHVSNARASVSSFTSASEEVLAGWAELGGGRDVVSLRGRRRR